MLKQDLKIVFMGTPEFAVPSLKALIDNNYNVVGVITAPDKKAGRGKKIRISAVKEFAINNNLKLLQPQNLKDVDFVNNLSSLDANLQVVVAFRMLPEVVWAMPKFGTFNLHASLLPQYRGAAPINYAIINGEQTTGLSTFFLDKKIDTGKIIYQDKLKINDDDDWGSLHDKMMKKGAKLILKTINSIINNEVTTHDQSSLINNIAILKIAPKINKDDCIIDWNNTAGDIKNLIRGLCPYPGASSTIISEDGLKYNIKIFKVNIIALPESNNTPGTIITDGSTYINVITKTTAINILELQLSGKKRMDVGSFLRGFKHITKFSFI